ncbi:neck passage structure protein [Streptococcus phage Str-PAP-1]|uniref:neck protein n=1 Tax=Streptococcus phage Str-PAP-1 TaxID=1589270 RepID=UPI000588E290|nr:neck protein [Streptococcus phage Str-PAP-1]AJD83085.1 neck passage structure protein [Streptococcus phage Str-PAP-1]
MTFLTNTLNLRQEVGGTKVKQGDFGSTFTFTLTDEQGNYYHELNSKTATITLCDDNNIVYQSTTLVSDSSVTFNIEKAVQTGVFYLEIKIDNYIFPSDRSCLISIEAGAVAYDLKDLIPNYDVNMTIDGILSDLNRQGGSVVDLLNKMASIYSNALTDHAEIIQARGGRSSLDVRLDGLDAKDSSLQAQITSNDADIDSTNARISSIVASAGDGTIPSELVDSRTDFDGKVYSLAGDHIRSIGKTLSEEIEASFVLTNKGYIEYSDGKETAYNNTAFNYSNKILVVSAKKILLTSQFAPGGTNGYAFYDNAGNYISGSNVYSEEIMVPNGAYYFAFTAYNLDISKIKVKIVLPTDIINNRLYYLENKNPIKKIAFTLTNDGYIDYKNGNFTVWATGAFYRSNKIDVSFAKELLLTSRFNGDAGCAFYDENGSFISGLNSIPSTITIPVNAKYFAFSMYRMTPSDVLLVGGYTFQNVINALNQKDSPTANFNYSYAIGKTLMIGDSLTSGYYSIAPYSGNSINQNVPYYVGKMTNNEVKNAGVSGIYPSKWFADELPKYNFADYDTVFIWLGTNNGLTDTMAADVNAFTDYNQYATTETGYYCRLIETIKNANPDVAIHISTCFHVFGGDIPATNKVINEIATKYDLNVINLSDLTVTEHPELHLNNGNQHFGKAGNIFIANRIINDVNSYYDANQLKLEFGLTPRTN